MKKEARLLPDEAIDSLVLAVELHNRPSDRGRRDSVLILVDHAFEMLLKASIVHRGGRIRDRRKNETIGFEACIRRGLTGEVKFLTDEQALLLQTVNGLRDAAQHHLMDISEQHLYVETLAGITLFRDLLRTVFGLDLGESLPERVLPLSTRPPTDIATFFESEVSAVRALLQFGRRRRLEASAKLKPLVILEGAMQGRRLQPSQGDLRRAQKGISSGKAWEEVFPGVACIEFTATGFGPSLDLRITKKDGVPIHLVPEGTPGASVVAIKRVNELDYYSLGHRELARKVGLTAPKTTAMVRALSLDSDPDCCREFIIGKTKFRRYSPKAIDRMQDALKTVSLDEVWMRYAPTRKKAEKTGRGLACQNLMGNHPL